MKTTIIRLMVCFLCLFPLFWGCDSQTGEPPQKPREIRKKIGAKPRDDASQVGKTDSSSDLEQSQAGKTDSPSDLDQSQVGSTDSSSDLKQAEPAKQSALKLAKAKPESSSSEKNKVIRKKITSPRPKDVLPSEETPAKQEGVSDTEEEAASSPDMKTAIKGNKPDGKYPEQKSVELAAAEPEPVTPEIGDDKPSEDKDPKDKDINKQKTASPLKPEIEMARKKKAAQSEKPASDAGHPLPDTKQAAPNDKLDKKDSEQKSVPDTGQKLAKGGYVSKPTADSATLTPDAEDIKPLKKDKDKKSSAASSLPKSEKSEKPDEEKEIARKDDVSRPKKSVPEADQGTPSLPDVKPPAKKDKPDKKQPATEISPKSGEKQKLAKTDEDGVSDKAMASLFGIGQKEEKAGKKDEIYNPKGKTDPFAPLFKEEKPISKSELEKKAKAAEAKKGKKKVKKKKRIPRTPLEKVDLSQLKLVGIVRAESGNRALVEEASGKGYIITKGTYIGIHSGRVSEILSNRIVVVEEGENFSGEITIRKRELKLQKPFGEDYYEM